MPLNFTAIDFETANQQRCSPCSVGLVKVVDGAIVDEVYFLMRPPEGYDSFHPMCVGVHGITPPMVANAPRFKGILPEMVEFIGGQDLVAHNSPFDSTVFRKSCEVSGAPVPELLHGCSLALSRRGLTVESHRLPSVVEHLGLSPLNHHNALSDSKACAEIVIAMAEMSGADSLEDLLKKHRLSLKKL